MEARCVRHHCICLENAAWRSIAVDLRGTQMPSKHGMYNERQGRLPYSTPCKCPQQSCVWAMRSMRGQTHHKIAALVEVRGDALHKEVWRGRKCSTGEIFQAAG
eukprot:scaffold54902_cov63-Phaeocystis_antarctica.AAC.1